MEKDIERVLISQIDIEKEVQKVGAQISADYAGEEPVFVGVLKGCFIFMADLMRHVTINCSMDFMAVSSYGNGAKSSGVVRILKDLSTDIRGRHVVIAEDIIDSGLTLKYLLKNLQSREPASLTVAALMRKNTPAQADIPCRYIGFECPDEFIVGYGLDFAEHYRNLPYIGVLKPEVYSK